MSLDPEELKRKRTQRKAQRQAARRKLVTRLILAGVALLLCGVLILTLSLRGCSRQEDTPTEPVTGESTPAPATDPGETLPPNTVIHFAAAGDLNVTQRVVASGGAEYDYTETFQDVAFLLADADLATVNLEGNLCGSPYGSNGSAPQSMMTALKKAGVDMIQLANSYSINRGISGLLTTIEGVKQAGMEPVGVFRDQAEFDSKQGLSLFEIKGVRIAVVSFTKGMDGTTLPPAMKAVSMCCTRITTAPIKRSIRKRFSRCWNPFSSNSRISPWHCSTGAASSMIPSASPKKAFVSFCRKTVWMRS